MVSEETVAGGRVDCLYPGRLETASPGQRVGGIFLDWLVAGFTGGIGWFIWLVVVSGRGQSPGKHLLGMYVLLADGRRAGRWRTILRQMAALYGPGLCFTLGLVAFITQPSVLSFLLLAACAAVGVLSNAWVLVGSRRQSFWDKLFGTLVGYAPGLGS